MLCIIIVVLPMTIWILKMGYENWRYLSCLVVTFKYKFSESIPLLCLPYFSKPIFCSMKVEYEVCAHESFFTLVIKILYDYINHQFCINAVLR